MVFTLKVSNSMRMYTQFVQITIVAAMILLAVTPSSAAAETDGPADATVAAGIQSVDVVGGQPAEQGEWGWQVMINAGGFLCGGSLIDANWVLTAAHCVYDSVGNRLMPAELRIIVGETDRHTVENTEQILSVDAIFVHDSYRTISTNDDLALLRLATSATLNKFVATIPMASKEQLKLTTAGQAATVTGWGMTSEGGRVANELMEATLPLVDNETCRRSYGNFITDNTLCAGYAEGGVDACQGDSGGPLVVSDDQGNWYLVGVVSFGFGCARADYYGVYVRVSQYVAWVETTMADNTKPIDIIVDDEDKSPDQPVVEPANPNVQVVFLPLVTR